jgi:hypothetical protein
MSRFFMRNETKLESTLFFLKIKSFLSSIKIDGTYVRSYVRDVSYVLRLLCRSPLGG